MHRRKLVFDGRIIKLYTEEWVEKGKYQYREVIKHPGAVAVIPLHGENIILIKQFRHAVEQYLYEIPAGLIEKNESPVETAIRETKEEIGARVKKIAEVLSFYSSPGFSNEILYVFLAEVEPEESLQNLDDDEHLEIIEIPLAEFLDMALKGEIKDSKTLIAAFYLLRRRRS